MSNNVPTAPPAVRITCAILLGIAVAVAGAPLGPGIKVIVLVLAAGGGLLFTFNHPYRRDVRKEVESRGTRYRTSAVQVMPLFPLWIALMTLPIINVGSIPAQWGLAVVALVSAAGYSYYFFPHIDGTAHLKRK